MKKFFSKVLQCVKLEEKINKINFNKFIWLYWKMKKKYNIYFIGGFPVDGTMKKKYNNNNKIKSNEIKSFKMKFSKIFFFC